MTLDAKKEVLDYTYANLSWPKLPNTLKEDAKGNAVLSFVLPDGNHAEFHWQGPDTITGSFWMKGKTTNDQPATTIKMTVQ